MFFTHVASSSSECRWRPSGDGVPVGRGNEDVCGVVRLKRLMGWLLLTESGGTDATAWRCTTTVRLENAPAEALFATVRRRSGSAWAPRPPFARASGKPCPHATTLTRVRTGVGPCEWAEDRLWLTNSDSSGRIVHGLGTSGFELGEPAEMMPTLACGGLR